MARKPLKRGAHCSGGERSWTKGLNKKKRKEKKVLQGGECLRIPVKGGKDLARGKDLKGTMGASLTWGHKRRGIG